MRVFSSIVSVILTEKVTTRRIDDEISVLELDQVFTCTVRMYA